VATSTFNTSVTDASGYTTLSGTSPSRVEASDAPDFWNGVYRSNPVGVTESGNLSFRSLIKIPIDFSTLTGAVQITGATLKLRYFNVNSTLNQCKNTGTRTVNIHRSLVSFTESPGSDPGTGLGWQSSTTQNWDKKLKTAGTHYDAAVVGSKTIVPVGTDAGVQANKALHEYDILPFILKIAPASLLVGSTTGVAGEGLANNGLLLKMSATGASQAAEYYSREGAATYATDAPTIVLTYTTNQTPTKPTTLSPNSGALQAGANITFTATFNDPDAGDTMKSFDIQITDGTDFSTTLTDQTVTATTISFVSPMTNYTSGIIYKWRVRATDAAGAVSAWSDEQTFTAPTNTSAAPPPLTGNTNFATTQTPTRSKYRVEVYSILASLNGFDPKPAAMFFDAKNIGVGTQVNGTGECFFTLVNTHDQIEVIDPQKTFFRICRWDKWAGYYRVMTEGIITRKEEGRNETLFYGIDKLGLLNRSIVFTDTVGATYSHVSVTLSQLHDSILRRTGRTATVTAASVTTGEITYTATSHPFRVGDVVTVTGTTGLDCTLSTVIATTSTTFKVKSALTATAWTGTASGVLAKSVIDLGWGESPTELFRDYSVSNPSSSATSSTTKSIQVSGQNCLDAISAFADLLMAGTTNKVILENPNIGLPAAAIDTMNVGLRYRHLTVTDIVKPGWWLQYGVNVKQYKLSDNLDQMSTRASVINRANIGSSLTSSPYNGDTDVDLYNQYLLIQRIEVTSEERNEIDYSAQFRYNTHPDRLFTLEVNVKPNWITPFDGYAVGDDLTVYIVDLPVNLKKDLTLVAQQWIANDNGAEYMAFAFSQRMEKEFLIRKETPLTPAPDGKTFPDLEPTSKTVDEGSTLDQMRGAPSRGIVGGEPQPDRIVEPPRIITPPQPTLPPEVTPPTPPVLRKPVL